MTARAKPDNVLVTSAERPFLDYYATLGGAPVSQNIADRQRHQQRRDALYRLLGLPPRFFGLAQVLEFGPGLGHNAVAVAAHGPQRHVLVEGSSAGIPRLQATLREHCADVERFEIVEALVEEFHSESPFDIVLAENLIPMQRDPRAFCRAIAAHVRLGGVLVVTCMTASSTLGETLRRIVALKIAPPPLPLAERVARLRPLFADHLAQLPGVSRPVDDWIKDNITHPLVGAFFSIEDAIEAVGDEFDAYGSSPSFTSDWRWYKQTYGDARRYNERLRDAYRANIANFMDWRVVGAPHDPETGARLEARCAELFDVLRRMEEEPQCVDLAALAARCESVADELGALVPSGAQSLREVAALLRADAGAPPEPFLNVLRGYFGRGVQYLSFIRRAGSGDQGVA